MSIQSAVKDQISRGEHGTWILLKADKGSLTLKATGRDIPALQAAFGDNEVDFALLTLRLTLQGIADQPRHVFFHWKGPQTSGMVRVQGNQKYQEALTLLAPHHGQVEVTNRNNFVEAVIVDKWGAGTGSHIID